MLKCHTRLFSLILINTLYVFASLLGSRWEELFPWKNWALFGSLYKKLFQSKSGRCKMPDVTSGRCDISPSQKFHNFTAIFFFLLFWPCWRNNLMAFMCSLYDHVVDWVVTLPTSQSLTACLKHQHCFKGLKCVIPGLSLIVGLVWLLCQNCQKHSITTFLESSL